jgi:hypothetical protein
MTKSIVNIIDSNIVSLIICVLGVLAQLIHSYYLLEMISPLSVVVRIIESLILSIFISGGLLLFTIKSGNVNNKILKVKYNKIANGFAILKYNE